MAKRNLLPLFAIAMLTLLRAADSLTPRAVPPFPQNLSPGGPVVPAKDAVESQHVAALPLWPNGAPDSESRAAEPEQISWRQEPDIVFPVISNIHRPSLTPFLPAKDTATSCAVIIAPGGGHMQLTIDREGYDLARWLAERGIAAFVLKNRLAHDTSTPKGAPQPYTIETHAQADAQRAIRLVRSRAAEWGVEPNRIGIMGFSAGGELALLTAAHHDAGQPNAADSVERVSSRPDFFAPIYPGGLQRTDLTWSKESTPPAFLACAADDRMSDQLTALFSTLRKAGVSAELHIYNRGGHGFGVRNDRPDFAVSSWHLRFFDWLGDLGLLKR